ncbi:ribbon-helix-helix domain-containing protein [Trichlorobacter lovleyi]|uniref:CopG domain protein DNA-binding domain protein n=1 Tax=Trichlorobacter lovleyi (strain ATCC BAA-1151 / DSM 17278 / SZ) TaxID=398767 RepID=B3E4V0_TRIL1|nr:CopG family transcriptional regulator [Trichlorobacter lovleyi]ACD96036.1 CopG domain protein DNA-binding domain protein [Trichlorobacter lovleyi SZ]
MTKRVAYNLYLSLPLHRQMTRLTEAGLSASAVARLAVQKRPIILPDGDDASCPVRTTIYVGSDTTAVLTELASAHGVSKAEVLRRLLTAYLDANRDCINALF